MPVPAEAAAPAQEVPPTTNPFSGSQGPFGGSSSVFATSSPFQPPSTSSASLFGGAATELCSDSVPPTEDVVSDEAVLLDEDSQQELKEAQSSETTASPTPISSSGETATSLASASVQVQQQPSTSSETSTARGGGRGRLKRTPITFGSPGSQPQSQLPPFMPRQGGARGGGSRGGSPSRARGAAGPRGIYRGGRGGIPRGANPRGGASGGNPFM